MAIELATKLGVTEWTSWSQTEAALKMYAIKLLIDSQVAVMEGKWESLHAIIPIMRYRPCADMAATQTLRFELR